MNMHKYRNQKLFAYAKRGRWMLLAGFFFALLSVIFDLLAPATVARILDGLLVDGEKIANVREFLLLLGLFLLSVVSGAGFGYASSVSFQLAANRIAQWMQEELFAHVQTLPISYFDMLPAGKVVSRITNDTRDVRILFQVVLAHVTIATLYLTGIYGTLLLMDWKMFLMALIPVPFLLYLFAD